MGRVRDKSASPARVVDRKPYIEVKDAIVARSGIYKYTYDEVVARGHTPKVKKAWYKELRPASVIVRSKDMFDLVPVPNKEHTDEYITPENFHTHTSGIVGGPIEVVALDDSQEIALKGRLAFFTKDAYEYYMAGNRETSADYESVSELVDNPEEVGYDLLMTEIHFVNNVAITSHGRGGSKVRVQDKMPEPNIIDKITGRNSMGFLGLVLGLNKSEKAFSAHVKDAIEKARTADTAGKEEALNGVMGMVGGFTESPAKQVLVGSVRDSFTETDKVLEKWKDAAPYLDGLFARCQDADVKLAAEIKDTFEKKDEKKKDDEDDDDDKDGKKKAAESKDSLDKVVSEIKDSSTKLIDERFTEMKKDLAGLITEGIKAAINPDAGGAGAGAGGSRSTDSAPDGDADIDYIFKS